MKKVSYSIDWLRATFDSCSDNSVYALPEGAWGKCEEIRAFGSYNNAIGSDFCSVSWHSEHPEMRVMFQMSGEQLSLYRKSGGDERQLVRNLITRGGKFTRLDFAIDIFDSGGDVLDFATGFKSGTVDTVAKKYTTVSSRSDEGSLGDTVYYGSRQSLVMGRAYDKAKQTNVSMDWIRYEIECKKERAIQIANDVAEHGIKAGGLAHTRRFIRSTEIEWFEQVFTGDYGEINIDSIGRPLTNREKWLFTVAIPNVAMAAKEGVPGVVEALTAIIKEVKDMDRHGPTLTLPHS